MPHTPAPLPAEPSRTSAPNGSLGQLVEALPALRRAATSSTFKPGRQEVAEALVEWLSGALGARFIDLYRGVDPAVVVDTWAQGITGYTPGEILRGMTAALRSKFPPTLPEFLLMCRPPVNYEAAYLEAVEQMRKRHSPARNDEWSHPAYYFAAARMGPDLFEHGWPAIKGRWTFVLDHVLADIERGLLPKEIPLLLPPPPEPERITKPMPPEVREKLRAFLSRVRIDTPKE